MLLRTVSSAEWFTLFWLGSELYSVIIYVVNKEAKHPEGKEKQRFIIHLMRTHVTPSCILI
jgi:hypothetical protein